MSYEYVPDNWVIFQVDDGYRILSGWKGGYLDSDSWRLSSGITNVKEYEEFWQVTNRSGSVYHLSKYREGISSIMFPVHKDLIELGHKQVTMDNVK